MGRDAGRVGVRYSANLRGSGAFDVSLSSNGRPLDSDRTANGDYQFDTGLRLTRFFSPLDLPVGHDALWRTGELNHPFSDAEKAWLQVVRLYARVPDGNTETIPPFRPGP